MKRRVLKSVVLGVGIGLSLLFANRGYACATSTTDSVLCKNVDNVKFKVVEKFGEEKREKTTIRDCIVEFKDEIADAKFEVFANLGEEYGKLSGVYKLDLKKSFDDVEGKEKSNGTMALMKNSIIICGGGEHSGGMCFLETEDVSIEPSNVYSDSDGCLISTENGTTLYWNKVKDECLLSTEDGTVVYVEKI